MLGLIGACNEDEFSFTCMEKVICYRSSRYKRFLGI